MARDLLSVKAIQAAKPATKEYLIGDERSHRRKADAQVERPDSRRPRSAVADPYATLTK